MLMLSRPRGKSRKEMWAIDARVTAPASATNSTSNSTVQRSFIIIIIISNSAIIIVIIIISSFCLSFLLTD